MVNIIVPDKRPNTANHTLQQERAEGDVWAAASEQGKDISLQISIYHLNHISLVGHPLNSTPDSKNSTFTTKYTKWHHSCCQVKCL